MEKYYHILNYGCQMNESDSEHYAGQLEDIGYLYTDNFYNADLVLVNTCCIRESAELKIYGKIGELTQLKRKNPDAVVCVAGCMAQKDGEAILKKYRHVDMVLGTSYVNSFTALLQEYKETGNRKAYLEMEVKSSEFEGHRVRKSGFSAWIPIMYGCNNFCTYCIVPYVRGRERSRSRENILEEVRAAVAEGYTEITLLGQNVNSYGKEFGEKDAFSNLLREVDKVAGIERVHYMTSHPKDMSEDLIRAVAEGKHLCKDFHVPFQSGSSRILKAMNRGYDREKYLALIERIRKYVPDATLSTDIIVGFPGETDADFEETCSMVEKVGFDSAFTFIYSKRSGTPAAVMGEQVDDKVKHERLNRLMEIQNGISLKKNKGHIGETVEVMAEGPTEKNPDVWSGRTNGNKLVLWQEDGKNIKKGDLLKVKITTAQTWILKGEAVR